jgi:hypothetical protein
MCFFHCLNLTAVVYLGHYGSGSSGSDWSNKSDEVSSNNWTSKKEDIVWDRNGTNHWGEPCKPSSAEAGTGSWNPNGPNRSRTGSASSWEENAPSWAATQNAPNPVSGGPGYDAGTSFWNDAGNRAAPNWAPQAQAALHQNRYVQELGSILIIFNMLEVFSQVKVMY